jgi:hypothetical protein
MTNATPIQVKGQGSTAQAARVGREVTQAATNALSKTSAPMHIDNLRLKLPAGASAAEVERAMTRAIAAHHAGQKR